MSVAGGVAPPKTGVFAPDVTGSCFWTSIKLVLSWNRFLEPRARFICVENLRTGLRIGTGYEPALALPWWKRGMCASGVSHGLSGVITGEPQ